MRRADRLFEIIQILRSAKTPVTASQLAETLEVTPRTVYRDMAALQAMRVPIEGGTGIGYVMRKGYDLPPLMFSTEEIEAIVLGLDLVRRTGDTELQTAAKQVRDKVTLVLPEGVRSKLDCTGLFSSSWGVEAPPSIDLRMVRHAIREERKLKIIYRDKDGAQTERTICPIAVVYYIEVVIIAAWCEIREDFRHFRADRVIACTDLNESFSGAGADMRAVWLASQNF